MRNVGVVFALLLTMLMILTVLPGVLSAEAASSPHVFIEEGAEEATYEEWNDRWPRYDANDDPISGQDYWCRQMHEVHSGERSVYCARNGINSHYLNSTGEQPWDVNLTSLSPSIPQTNYVLRYDTNEDAIMHKAITGAQYYNKITMTFWFYSDTGHSNANQPDSGKAVGYDFLNAIYYTGSGENRVKHVAWTDSYAEATAKKWAQVSVTIPRNATEVGFEFVSGSEAPEGGDAPDAFSAQGIRVLNGGMKEGVFLDDISVVGTEPAANVPLATAVDSLPAFESNRSFPVNIADNNPQVGLKYANLYYRAAGDDNWTKYTTAENPDGAFSVLPITFTAPRDGTYEFLSVGVDMNGTAESMRSSADATTVVDTTAPTSNATVIGHRVGDAYTGAAAVIVNGSDEGSGIDHITYRIDGGEWARYEGGIGLATNGTHQIEYYATDKANNSEGVKSMEASIVNGAYGIVFHEPGKSFPDGNVTINFTVAAGSPIDKLEYSLDQGAYTELNVGSPSIALTGVSDGHHSVIVRAVDSNGSVIQGEDDFTVGSTSTSVGGVLGDMFGQPMVLIGLVAVVLAVIGGSVWYVRRKR